MISASVTLVEAFRWWRASDLPWEWFVEQNLTRKEPTLAMQAGSALHKALETVGEGEFDQLTSPPFTFHFDEDIDTSIKIAANTEVPCQKRYSELTVRGRVDRVDGNVVRDYKLRIGSFDADKAESYIDSFQWRFYLDIMQADVFEYIVFEAKETDDPYVYVIRAIHSLRQYRYPDLATDCRRLSFQYEDAASLHPELVTVTPEPPKVPHKRDVELGITDDDLPAWYRELASAGRKDHP